MRRRGHTERSHTGKAEIIDPSHDDEAPVCARVVHRGRELGEKDGADHVCEAHGKISTHDKFTTPDLVDHHHQKEFADEAND